RDLVSRNMLIVGATAIGVPAGIAVALKIASTRKGKWRMNSRDAARTLFPKIDPIAGEVEKVRPVIEELERMLGKKMDTAVNATELLDRFASGGKGNSSED
ncbi:MAG: hypothetical protein MN733_35985, partial [Nitrososphaera sp.]|nr:hypothetical protein [Nitrososphaera sp.]